MRKTLGLLLVCLPLLLTGCSGHGPQEADHVGDKIKAETQTARHELDEGAVTMRIKTAFAASEKLKGSHLSVTTESHQVKLSGTVVTEAQKSIADRIAHDTVGADMTVVDSIATEKRAAQNEKPKK